jgi:enoyl-CoA hydratase/carnithine racemase
MAATPLPMQQEASGPCPGAIILKLEQPGRPLVVLDLELIQRLETTLKALPRDATGLVLASASERVFIAGADLKSISEWDDTQLGPYLQYGARVFGMIASLPFSTVAAINGAALGGGLEIAMHCDGLVAAPPPAREGQPGKPYQVGLPEASLGLCPGWGGTNLLPARIDPAEGIRRAATGETMTFGQAASFGLFDRLAPSPERLLETALAWLAEQHTPRPEPRDEPLRWIGRPVAAARVLAALDSADLPDTGSARAVRESVNAGLTEGWGGALAAEQRHLLRLRHTPEARASLAAFFAKAPPKPAAR